MGQRIQDQKTPAIHKILAGGLAGASETFVTVSGDFRAMVEFFVTTLPVDGSCGCGDCSWYRHLVPSRISENQAAAS
jgi:hypothetical protein